MTAIFLNELGLVCALGQHPDEVAARLFTPAALNALSATTEHTPGTRLALGKVNAALPNLVDQPVPWRGRNNALLQMALQPMRAAIDAAIQRYGPQRIAVVLGTSTSGVGESEQAHRQWRRDAHWPDTFHYAQQEIGTPALFVRAQLGLCGPAQVISTACSSSAKALASAARWLQAGLVDAVIAGGADSLCGFTIAGFHALSSVSAERCNPFSRNRCGINIGEGAALFLLSREPAPVRLAGWGESSDAHHMSAPDPDGQGAEAAIRQALQRASLPAKAIDYVNLHGTATRQNDAMEAKVMHRVFGSDIPMSSSKPLTGHTLGAAGAIEAALCWLSLTRNPPHRLLPHVWDGEADDTLPRLNLIQPGDRSARPQRYALSPSFAFGGSNAALVLGAE